MLAWDNTARRGADGTVFHNFSPEKHRVWLWRNVGRGMREHGQTLAFINAWNEWAEGATLEPDDYWGYANLAAARDVARLKALAPFDAFWHECLPLLPLATEGLRLALIATRIETRTQHDHLQNLARILKHDLGCALIFILAPNDCLAAYKRLGRVYVPAMADRDKELKQLAASLKNEGLRFAVSFNLASGKDAAVFSQSRFRIVQLAYDFGEGESAQAEPREEGGNPGDGQALVFASGRAGDAFCNGDLPALENVFIVPRGIKLDCELPARRDARAVLAVPAAAIAVAGGSDSGHCRDGLELFIFLAALIQNKCGGDGARFLESFK